MTRTLAFALVVAVAVAMMAAVCVLPYLFGF